jgi:hypothetical protein
MGESRSGRKSRNRKQLGIVHCAAVRSRVLAGWVESWTDRCIARRLRDRYQSMAKCSCSPPRAESRSAAGRVRRPRRQQQDARRHPRRRRCPARPRSVARARTTACSRALSIFGTPTRAPDIPRLLLNPTCSHSLSQCVDTCISSLLREEAGVHSCNGRKTAYPCSPTRLPIGGDGGLRAQPRRPAWSSSTTSAAGASGTPRRRTSGRRPSPPPTPTAARCAPPRPPRADSPAHACCWSARPGLQKK